VADSLKRPVLGLTSLLFVAGTIGSNIGPALVDERPLLVLTMSARNRNLFGAVPFVDPAPWAVIGFVRLLLAAVCLYLVGLWYGDRALRWVESQLGELPAIYHWTERLADRAGWLAILLMPGSNIVCLLVGHLKMPPARFVALAVTGIVVRLAVLWSGGKQVEDEIQSVVGWINGYQWWIVGGLFALTLFQSARRRSPGVPDDTDNAPSAGQD